MKTHLLRMRTENRDIFYAIKTNKKRVETRAASVKFRNIKIGDTLKFSCGRESFEREVKAVKKFKTIRAILKEYKPQEINPKAKTESDIMDIYYSFPGYRDKIKKFGLIALDLK